MSNLFSHRAAAALVASCLVTGFGAAANAGVSVSVEFSPAVLRFSPTADPQYIFALYPNATGFTDDSNLDNFIKIESANGEFSGDLFPARFTGTGTAGSIALPSVADLSSTINASSAWTITLTDGVSGVTSRYSLNVSTGGIGDEYLRPLTLDLVPGSNISPNQTVNWTQPGTANPSAQYTSAFAFFLGDIPGNAYGNPGLLPTDTTWTVDGPMSADVYTFVLGLTNNTPDQTLVTISNPLALDGAEEIDGFTSHISMICQAQSSGLIVPAPGSVAMFTAFGLLSARRRRA